MNVGDLVQVNLSAINKEGSIPLNFGYLGWSKKLDFRLGQVGIILETRTDLFSKFFKILTCEGDGWTTLNNIENIL